MIFYTLYTFLLNNYYIRIYNGDATYLAKAYELLSHNQIHSLNQDL